MTVVQKVDKQNVCPDLGLGVPLTSAACHALARQCPQAQTWPAAAHVQLFGHLSSAASFLNAVQLNSADAAPSHVAHKALVMDVLESQ